MASDIKGRRKFLRETHRCCCQQGLSLHDIHSPVPELALCEGRAVEQDLPRDGPLASCFASQSVQLRQADKRNLGAGSFEQMGPDQ